MQTLIVIYGFMGPLILVGTIGLIYILNQNKKEQKRKHRKEGGMRLSR